MLIVCTKCKLHLDCTQMGVWVMYFDLDGNIERIYRGDVYGCRACDFQVVTDFGKAITTTTHPDGALGFRALAQQILATETFFTFLGSS